MENKEIIYRGRGIKVNFLSAIFIVVGVITMIASLFLIKKIYVRYDQMANSYQFEEVQREAAYSFKNAFDYMSEQSRWFVVTGNLQNAENYFDEKNTNKRREAAIATIENSYSLELESNLFKNALELSESMAEQEIHAMALAAEAMNIDKTQLPDEIASYMLQQSELEIDSLQQQNLAVQLLYSNEYKEYNKRINWDIDNAIILIKDESEALYREAEADLIVVLNITTALVFVMFVLLMLIFIFNTLLVVKPAKKFVDLLDKNEKLPEIGGYEFRDFARKYNDIYRSNKKNRELLKEQGEVDELTGTLKVNTLELIKHNLSQNNEPLGIMMIDVDNFRSIKENNGYDMADKVIVKVAKLFSKAFKQSDYIIRTGQDTFVIFLLRMKADYSNLLLKTVNEINMKLKDTSDGVVSSSVSVGVSFSENGFTNEAEIKADMALNYVKENAKGSCKIS